MHEEEEVIPLNIEQELLLLVVIVWVVTLRSGMLGYQSEDGGNKVLRNDGI
jgi:hypothetical protein